MRAHRRTVTAAATGSPGPLRVGVNLCWLVPGVVGGSESLLVGWLAALADVQDEVQEEVQDEPRTAVACTVFGSGDLLDAHPFLGEAFEFVTAPTPGGAKAMRVVTETTWLAARRRSLGLDVLHHAGGVVPIGARGRTVLTVHDIQPLDLPANFGAVKRRYLAAMLPRSIAAADVVVTTSDFVVDRLVARLGADRQRCRVVAPVLPRRSAVDAATVAQVRARHGLPEGYVLYPAISYPHKNHRVLLEAMRLLQDADGRDAAGPAGPGDISGPGDTGVHLVLSGADGPLDAELAAQARRDGTAGRVHRLGRVPRAELDALVSGAAALVFPSTYEGFGLGAFDALAAGAPILAADIAPLAEVLGPGAVLIDPHDAAAWARRITEVAASPAARRALAAASVQRAAVFDRRASAEALLDAYRAAATGPIQPSPPSPPSSPTHRAPSPRDARPPTSDR